MGVDDPIETRYSPPCITKFCRSSSNLLDAGRVSKFWGTLGPPPLGTWTWLTPLKHVTAPPVLANQISSLWVKPFGHNYENPPENFDPCVPPFKVTQGHWNRRGSIAAHDFLLMIHSNHGPIKYRFRDKRRFLSKIANFSHPLVFNTATEGFPLGIL